MKKFINLQLLTDGGAGAGASTGEAGMLDGGAATGVVDVPGSKKGEDLSNVVYGRSINQDVANPNGVETPNSSNSADLQKEFDEMVKKGGKYAEAFNKKFQDIFDKRFKETKTLEESYKETLKSHESIMNLLAAKYGVDGTDPKALEKAISEDTSLYEEAAFKEGLNVDQYKEKLKLEAENARMKEALEERKREERSNEIYADWLRQKDALVEKYGLQNFDMATEMENPQFTQLLSSGVDFESAYKTVHFDDMVQGAMAQTAQNVSKAMVNNIQNRNRRPAENGTQSASSKVFKTDPSKFTIADLDEIKRRVAAGEQIPL